MMYLSAQPDEIYFIWQLQIQLLNFHKLGISSNKIHILVGFNPAKGINKLFKEFSEENQFLAEFFFYPDLREDPKYISSIRPHLIKQHYLNNPHLERTTIFYHDSDVLFSRIPVIKDLFNSEICYVSDTRDYLDVSYIIKSGSEELLEKMIEVVGIAKSKLLKENENTGGAQYILRGLTSSFWDKVEKDSEKLYVLMQDAKLNKWKSDFPEKHVRRKDSYDQTIQSWCADMWGLLWNLWLAEKDVKIHAEMDFCWAESDISEWYKKPILHYTGAINDNKRYFKKSDYKFVMPWYDDKLLQIPNGNCSSIVVQLIRDYRTKLDELRSSQPNECIIIYSQTQYSDKSSTSFFTLLSYLHKNLNIPIYFYSDDLSWKNLEFEQKYFHFGRLISDLKDIYLKSLLIPMECIFDIKDLMQILNNPSNEAIKVYKTRQLYFIDNLFNIMFARTLDFNILHSNIGKFHARTTKSNILIIELDLNKQEITDEIFQFILSSTYNFRVSDNLLEAGFYLVY